MPTQLKVSYLFLSGSVPNMDRAAFLSAKNPVKPIDKLRSHML